MSQPKWITPELIELSKRAKGLGFPQDVEEGDWVHSTDGRVNTDDELLCISDYLYEDLEEGELAIENPTLILEFSRCLEWFQEKFGSVEVYTFGKELGWYFNWGDKTERKHSGTHHEAIAKAVCKILSEGQEVKILEEEQCK